MKTNPSLNELDNNNNTKPKKTKTLPKNKKSHDTFFNRNFINLIKSENFIFFDPLMIFNNNFLLFTTLSFLN